MARVTVGMPTYNAESHIEEAIESILNQSFGDLELLISDNASTDRTEEICRAYAEKDARVTYIRQSVNMGATENYNFVCRQSDAEFFKWHSSNDICTEETVARCINKLVENSDVVLAYPRTKLFRQILDDAADYDDNLVANENLARHRFFHIIDNMALNNVMNGVIRTSVLQKTPLIRGFLYADRNMVAELALMGKVLPVDGCIFYRRMDAESATYLKSEIEVLAHFDPSWKRQLFFTNWRIFSAYFSSLVRCDFGFVSLSKSLPMLARRLWWAKAELWQDITTAARYAASDFYAAVTGGRK